MKPIRRKLRGHFGLTAKQVAIRSHSPWYFRWLLPIAFMCIGCVMTYFLIHDDDAERLRLEIEQIKLENSDLQSKLISAQRELQVELATNNNLAKELTDVQEENLAIKGELVFYKTMLDKKTK